MDFARVFDPQLNAKEAKIQKKKYISPAIRLMKEGDLIITYERHDSMDHLYLIKDQIYGNKFGAFHHNDFIGKPFGSKITCRSNNTRWVYALEPSPELWSAALHVRARIYLMLCKFLYIISLSLYLSPL